MIAEDGIGRNEIMRRKNISITNRSPLVFFFTSKYDKMHMFFDGGTIPLNGKRDERHE